MQIEKLALSEFCISMILKERKGKCDNCFLIITQEVR